MNGDRYAKNGKELFRTDIAGSCVYADCDSANLSVMRAALYA
jgi:hypothetical protein